MARYTETIYEILQRENPEIDLTNTEGIYNSAMHSIFSPDMISVISDKYRKQFVIGFTLHFFQDEIGFSTNAMFKMALLEKLYNNYDRINQIYQNIDKFVFSDYHIHKTTNDTVTTNNLINKTTGTSDNTGSVDNSGKSQSDNKSNNITDATRNTDENNSNETINHNIDSVDESNNVTNSGTDTVTTEHGHVVETADSGIDTVTHTGTVDNQSGGKDTNHSVDDNKVVYTANDTSDTDNIVHNNQTLKVTNTTDKSGAKDTTTQHGKDMTSHTQIFSDTPQSGLSDLENGRYATNATFVKDIHDYDYDPDGQRTDVTHSGTEINTSINEYNHADIGDVTNTNVHNHNNDETKTDNKNESYTIYGKSDKVTNDLSDTTTHGLTQTSTNSGSDVVSTNNGLQVETKHKNLITTDGQNTDTAINHTDDVNHVEDNNKSSSLTQTVDFSKSKGHTENDTTNTNTGTVEVKNEVTDEDYTLSYEMLTKAEPYLTMIWNLFDDCFMLVSDAFYY